MALVSCPDCGKEVSTHAEACPYCGCPKDVILESMKEEEATESNEPEMSEEELKAKREEIRKAVDDLTEKFGNLSNEIEGIQKNLKEERETLDKNAQKSWTWMKSGSLWWF